MQKLLRNLFVAMSLMTVWSLLAPTLARADDWGCQVLLCLADPRGPETESACVPPIEKLWSELRHGHAFPTCDFNSSLNGLPGWVRNALPASVSANFGAGTGASNTWAGAGYCREDLLFWTGVDQSQLACRASGAIDVKIDGQLYTRVWWGVGGLTSGSTLSEYYGQGSSQASYDPTQAATLFMQRQQQRLSSGNDGDGGN